MSNIGGEAKEAGSQGEEEQQERKKEERGKEDRRKRGRKGTYCSRLLNDILAKGVSAADS